MNRKYFQVNPRFTSGSPGQVPEEIANSVALDEQHTAQFRLAGRCGETERLRAEQLGLAPRVDRGGVLRGIVEEIAEHSDHWLVRDLLTHQTYVRPFPHRATTRRCARCSVLREQLVDTGAVPQ